MHRVSVFLDFVGGFAIGLALGLLIAQMLGVPDNALVRAFGAVLVGLLYAWLAYLARKPRERTLRKDSKKFAKYYSDWYSADGEIYIFCDDVDWLEGEQRREIVSSLKRKGARAHLYLRHTRSELLVDLESAGVSITQIPEEVRVQAKLSLRVDSGYKSLIIRTAIQDAKNGGERNVFTESRDPVVVGFCEDVIRSIDPAIFDSRVSR
jgi:hypothetical protein